MKPSATPSSGDGDGEGVTTRSLVFAVTQLRGRPSANPQLARLRRHRRSRRCGQVRGEPPVGLRMLSPASEAPTARGKGAT
jgi:hypothetical protein